MDIYEEGGDIVVKAEIPGMTKEEIHVDINEKTVTVSGEKGCLPKCTRMRSRPWWIEPEVCFRIVHVAGEHVSAAPRQFVQVPQDRHGLKRQGDDERCLRLHLLARDAPDRLVRRGRPRYGIRMSPEMLRCERVAGSDFKITLELDRPIIIYEPDKYDDFPWHVSRRMGGSSRVVIRQALFQIACKAHIALVGVGYAPEKVDILHGHHPWLRRMMLQHAKGMPYFAQAPYENLRSLELRRVILRGRLAFRLR